MREWGAIALAALVAIAASTACVWAAEAALGQVLVEQAYVLPSTAGTATAYLVINNETDFDVVLIGVTTPAATKTQMVTRRGRLLTEGVTIPAHAELYMQPDGLQVWLSGIAGTFSPEGGLELQLRLGDGTTAKVMASVVASESDIPDHHDYRHE